MGLLRDALKTLAGALLGAGLGLWIYIMATLFFSPTSTSFLVWNLEELDIAISQIAFSFAFYEIVAVLAGALFGIAVVHSRELTLVLTTTVLGALGGLIVFIAGFMAVHAITNGGLGTQSFYGLLIMAIHSATPAQHMSIALGAFLGFLVARSTWRFSGLFVYVALTVIVMGYLTYTFVVTLPQMPVSQRLLSITLFAAELTSLVMVVLYAFYTLDFSTKVSWRRAPAGAAFSAHYKPKVAFQVACYNEPPEIVIGTLNSLLRVDYPKDRYEIMVMDDSTDSACWQPVKKFCQNHGIKYLRRAERKGFKAGALNYSLKKTSRDTELIAIIDADYQVEKDYLREVVGYFINPKLGFLQTPQDYRNKYENYLTEQYYYADSYFYRVIMLSRNEANAIIFAGTMGIIRKSVLEEVGVWGEEFICEDAELSVRILNAGYESLYVNHTFGRGLIPTTFDGYKKQLYRWSFGGVKIMKAHFWKFLVSAKMTLRQKFDFLVGGIHWFDGIWILLIAAIVALLALADLLGWPLATYHQREIWLVGLVPIFLLVDGITRLHMALKLSMGVSLRGTFRVMGMWYSVKFSNTRAAVLALFGINKPFIRTSKKPPTKMSAAEATTRAVSLTKFETFWFLFLFTLAIGIFAKSVAAFAVTGIFDYTKALLIFWLVFYSLLFFSAPLYAYRSYTREAVRDGSSSRDIGGIGTALTISLLVFALAALPVLAAHTPDTAISFTDPSFSPPNGSQYNPSAAYAFGIVIKNETFGGDTIDPGSVKLRLGRPDGSLSNYTRTTTPSVTNASSGVFNITFSQSQLGPAGTYTLTWFAKTIVENDTEGQSSEMAYAVTRNANTSVSLTLNGTAGDRTYEIGDVIGQRAQASVSGLTVTLFNNFGGSLSNVGTGTTSVEVANITDSIAPSATLSVSPTSIRPEETVSISCSVSDVGDLDPGTYTVAANATGNENYTSSSTQNLTATLVAVAPAQNLTVTKPSGNTFAANCGDQISGSNTSQSGTYTVRLTVTDEAGNRNETTKTFEAQSVGGDGDGNDGDDGGGGGGGGGGSPRRTIAEESAFLNVLNPGVPYKLRFPSPEVAIDQIVITVKEQARNVRITITKLEERPASVRQDIPGKVYQYINITTENLAVSNIESTEVRFSVSREWIEEQNVDIGTVAMYRYSTQWDRLDTSTRGVDIFGELYFTSEAPGFSTFAIVGKEAIAPSNAINKSKAPVNETLVNVTSLQLPPEIEKRISGLLIMFALLLTIGASLLYWKWETLFPRNR